MIAPRRFLPSISSLLALEAVDRLGTAISAAEELSLTHSAVSRQLKVLEEQIGVSLFFRGGKSLRLTPAGVVYARSVRVCLHDLARASLKVKASGSRANINLAVLPAFGMYWLGPRLKPFADRRPDLLINQATRLEPFDFDLEDFDAAIHYGDRQWAGVSYLPLLRERVIPACAPQHFRAAPYRPEDVLEQPLLHLTTRPGAWEDWFSAHGVAATNLRGMLFDQFSNIAEASVSGFGFSLLPEFLAEREFSSGRLVPGCASYVDVSSTYYLVWPEHRPMSEPLHDLITWFKGEDSVQRLALEADAEGQGGPAY